jgi:NTE family protein
MRRRVSVSCPRAFARRRETKLAAQQSTKAAPSTGRLAVVLSGGGARGAYEAGVLSYLFSTLPERLGRPLTFDIITGTSVGAVHASYCAAMQGLPDAGEKLEAIWRSLSLDRVFAPGFTDLFTVPLQLIGLAPERPTLPPTRSGVPERLAGLFDTTWLEEIVIRNIDWARIHERVDSGVIQAIAVAATEISTGRSAVFVDTGGRPMPEWPHDRFVVARPTRLGPAHALASAAIPLAFPALRIDRTYYCDGGLRLNTPLAPALRLGADRVLVIGLRHPRPTEEEDRIAQRREKNYANPTYLAGKALNALLLDRIEHDVARLRMFNAILRHGVAEYGPDFPERISAPIVAERKRPYRIVEDYMIRPSKDLGRVAAECLRHQGRSRGIRDWLSRNVVKFAGRGALAEADLLSYLFFDRCFAEHLIELGREDAAAVADELVEFLDGPPHPRVEPPRDRQ